jgi:hypothetical protein
VIFAISGKKTDSFTYCATPDTLKPALIQSRFQLRRCLTLFGDLALELERSRRQGGIFRGKQESVEPAAVID